MNLSPPRCNMPTPPLPEAAYALLKATIDAFLLDIPGRSLPLEVTVAAHELAVLLEAPELDPLQIGRELLDGPQETGLRRSPGPISADPGCLVEVQPDGPWHRYARSED